MQTYQDAARLLRAAAHPVRLQLLSLLDAEEQCVCHLTALTGRRQSYVSQQLMELRRSGFVRVRHEGLRVYYRVSDPCVRELVRLLVGRPAPSRPRQPARGCHCPRCLDAK